MTFIWLRDSACGEWGCVSFCESSPATTYHVVLSETDTWIDFNIGLPARCGDAKMRWLMRGMDEDDGCGNCGLHPASHVPPAPRIVLELCAWLELHGKTPAWRMMVCLEMPAPVARPLDPCERMPSQLWSGHVCEWQIIKERFTGWLAGGRRPAGHWAMWSHYVHYNVTFHCAASVGWHNE